MGKNIAVKIIVSIVILISLLSNCTSKTESKKHYMQFGAGFDHDTIYVMNHDIVLYSKIITTNATVGFAGYFDKYELNKTYTVKVNNEFHKDVFCSAKTPFVFVSLKQDELEILQTDTVLTIE